MKNIFFGIMTTVLLSGCMATTGQQGTQSTASLQAASVEKSCAELEAQMASLQADVDAGKGATTGTSAASIGAAAGGSALSMAGIPLLGVAVSQAGVLSNVASSNLAERAQKAQAELSTVSGVYAGKGCGSSAVAAQ